MPAAQIPPALIAKWNVLKSPDGKKSVEKAINKFPVGEDEAKWLLAEWSMLLKKYDKNLKKTLQEVATQKTAAAAKKELVECRLIVQEYQKRTRLWGEQAKKKPGGSQGLKSAVTALLDVIALKQLDDLSDAISSELRKPVIANA